MPRIMPEGLAYKQKSSRLKNFGKWIIALVGFPSTYIHLPFSCCFKNPVAHVMYKEDELDEHIEPINKVMLNMIVGIRSLQLWICCAGCCFGYCCKIPPSEFD